MAITINEENREEGEETIYLLIEDEEKPEFCEECPFHMRNINRDKLEDEEGIYYCLIKAKLVSAQFGGIDVKDPRFFKCPLKPIIESDPFRDHEARITALEEALSSLEATVESLKN